MREARDKKVKSRADSEQLVHPTFRFRKGYLPASTTGHSRLRLQCDFSKQKRSLAKLTQCSCLRRVRQTEQRK
jgi:hypothetical protein